MKATDCKQNKGRPAIHSAAIKKSFNIKPSIHCIFSSIVSMINVIYFLSFLFELNLYG
ncbi:hypothetical protein LguiA_002712 [Lonicera macranthoides]